MATISKEGELKDHVLRDFLNKEGGKTDNVFGSKFRKLANINKWSRYKPVSYNKVTALSEQELKLANYGLSNYHMGRTTTPKELMDLAIQGTDFYPYVPPKGGESSPYRSADFRGYNADAEPPYIVQAPSSLEPAQFPAYIGYSLYLNPSPNAELKISDLASFEDVIGLAQKIGILWTGEDGLYYLYYSPSANIEEGIFLDMEVNGEGTHHFLAVWFSWEVSEGNNEITNEAINFVPVPDSYRKVVVTQKQIWGIISVDWDSLNGLYYYKANGMIQGFSTSYPYFTLSFPNGTPPSCSYRIGMYINAVIDGTPYEGYYWYDDEYIYHPSSAERQIFVNFPTEISLSDVLGFDVVNMDVQSIEIRLDLERVDGYGFLSYDNMYVYNVTIYN